MANVRDARASDEIDGGFMNPEIHEIPFEKRLYGRSKPVLENQKPVDAMFAAMDETWKIVRGNSIPNAGLNHIIYTNADRVFAGVEIVGSFDASWGLEQVDLVIPCCIYYRHEGSYDLLGQAYARVNAEIVARGLVTTGLSLEIYGHWSEDPAKLVTELLIGLK
jgi:effector-binding domain-containing protein